MVDIVCIHCHDLHVGPSLATLQSRRLEWGFAISLSLRFLALDMAASFTYLRLPLLPTTEKNRDAACSSINISKF